MTDVVALAERLYKKVNQQRTPEEVVWTDLVNYIVEAIESLYVLSGRTFSFDDGKFEYDETGVAISFADELKSDEKQWV